jgi:post-segregation antitoxin (ccd killing protein)
VVEEESVKVRIPSELWERVKVQTSDVDSFALEAVKQAINDKKGF